MTNQAWGARPVTLQFGDEHLGPHHASSLQGWIDQHPESLNAEEKLRSKHALVHLRRRLHSGGAPVQPFVTVTALVLSVIGAGLGLWYSVSASTGLDSVFDRAHGHDLPATQVVGQFFPVFFLPMMIVVLATAVLAAATPTWTRVISIILALLSLLTVALFLPFFGGQLSVSVAQPMLAIAGSTIVFVLAWILGGRK